MILEALAGLTEAQKAEFKSTQMALIPGLPKSPFTYNGLVYSIQLYGVEKLTGGIAVYARVWNNLNKQYGFGPDGSVDIERFRIWNPPILVSDAAGTIVQNSTFLDGTILVRKFREDPLQAIAETIIHTALTTAKLGTNIVTGRIGRTTDIFYSAAGAVSPTDGYVGKDDSNVWATTRNALDGNSSTVIGTTIEHRNLYGNGNGPDFITLFRVFLLFDTSTIPLVDEITSATLSVFGISKAVTGGNEYLYAVASTPALTSTLSIADYDQLGATSFGDSGATFSTTTYNNITLNGQGLAAISKVGITKLGLRGYYDFNNIAPDSTHTSSLNYYPADNAGTTNDPKLTVVHALPTTISSLLHWGVGR